MAKLDPTSKVALAIEEVVERFRTESLNIAESFSKMPILKESLENLDWEEKMIDIYLKKIKKIVSSRYIKHSMPLMEFALANTSLPLKEHVSKVLNCINVFDCGPDTLKPGQFILVDNNLYVVSRRVNGYENNKPSMLPRTHYEVESVEDETKKVVCDPALFCEYVIDSVTKEQARELIDQMMVDSLARTKEKYLKEVDKITLRNKRYKELLD